MRKKLLFALLLCVSTPAFSDVFGLRMGMSQPAIDNLKSLKKNDFRLYKWIDGTYFIPSKVIPKPNKKFLEYFASISEKNGLCMIRAETWSIYPNKNGDKLIDKFEELSRDISKDYGKGMLINTLPTDDTFMDSLARKDGNYDMRWLDNKSKFTNNIHAILLHSSAINDKICKITVIYIFNNSDSSCIGSPHIDSSNLR